jgi:hypothetical protein
MTDGKVTMTTDVTALAERLAERTIGTVHDELDKAVRATFAEAEAAWPVKTGRSKASMRLVEQGTGDARTWLVKVDAYYAGMIHQAGMDPLRTRDRLLVIPLGRATTEALERAASRIEAD